MFVFVFFSCDYAVEPEVLDLRTPNCSPGPGSDWGKKEKKIGVGDRGSLGEGKEWWSLETCHEHQNLVSWNGGIKGMSTGSAALPYDPNPQATSWLAWFADIISYLTPFLALFPHFGA